MAAAPKTAPPPMPAAGGDLSAAAHRLGSLDAYRGLVMVALAARGFGISQTARNFPGQFGLADLGYQFSHVPWVGCSFR